MVVFDFQPEFNKTVLSNGVTVVTEHHRNTRATCAAIFVRLGTRHEPKGLGGAAHFIEHLVFKGTKKRTAYDIARALESVGGEINAFTSREYTCFHTTSLREDLNLSMDVLCDVINNASMVSAEFEKEREVVLQEIDMTADQLEEYIFDLCFEEAYKGHSLGLPILGTKETLRGMKLKSLKDYYGQRYRADQLIVAVAGDVDHSEVVRICKEALGRKKVLKVSGKDPFKSLIDKKNPHVKPFRKFVKRPSEQVHMALNFPSTSYKSANRFDAYMVNAILGGGMTSRLYQSIREDKGWVYSVYSFLSSFTDSGMLSLYAGTTDEFLMKVTNEFVKQVERLIERGVAKKELEFFKQQVRGQLLLGADDIENRLNSIAVNEMIFGEYRPVEKVLEHIDKVTTESMQTYCKEFFDWSRAGLLIVGNASEATVASAFKLIDSQMRETL